MPRDRGPALVVDAAVHEHLEVLRLAVLRRVRVVEGRDHAAAVQRQLLDAVHAQRLGHAGGVEDGRGDVDHVAELGADLTAGAEALRPVHDRAVAGAAPMRRDLLRPLVGRVHRMRPAHGVVVVGLGSAELVDPRRHELRRLQAGGAVEHDQLVEAALRRALRGGPVVADDVVDQRVVEDLQVLERVDQPAHVVVRVLEEPGVDLHLAREHGLQVIRHVVPGRDLRGTLRELRVRRDHAQFLLARRASAP